MAIKGTLYGLAKTKNDVDGLEKFKSMIKEVNSSGAVVIDGRNIAADSIFANQISADAITAKQIKAGTITTDHITTSGISADKIKAGQLTAQNNASWLNLNNGQFSFGGGKIVYNGSTLSINVESLKITNKPVATQDDAKNLADNAVEGLEVGGRNYFTKSHRFIEITANSSFSPRDKETPNGFKVTGNKNANGQIRLSNAINSDGWWTVSFDVKGSQSGAVSMTIDICDLGSTRVLTNSINTYKRVSISVFVTNYSDTTYNFVDFGAIGWNYFWVDNIKVEKGQKGTDWSPAPEDVDAAIDLVNQAANNAQKDANSATGSATTANNLLTDLANDNKLTASEKKEAKKEWDIIVGEKPKIEAEATNYTIGTEKTTFVTRYNTLNSYITPLLTNLNATSDIVGTTFRAHFKNYYDARQDVLNAITSKAKSLADSAQTSIDSLEIGGRNLAIGTSEDFNPKDSFSNFNGVTNTIVNLQRVYLKGLSAGDTVSVRLVYEYNNIVPVSGQTARMWTQGAGNVTNWNGGTFGGSPQQTIVGSGTHIFEYSFELSAQHLQNDYWLAGVRHDYVQSGSVRFKMFKVERGTKATDWTPAPEDVDDAINAAQTDATNAKGKTDAWTYTGTTEINGGKIKADTVTATQIAANTITANQIATNAITADKILAKSIIAGKIAANAVTADEIKAGTITAKEIAAGTLTANEIKAGAITVDKIAVGDFTNYAAWDKTAGTYPLQSGALDTSVFRSSRGSIKLSTGQTGYLKSDIEVVYGESIYYEFWVKTDTNWNGTTGNSKFRIGDQNNGILTAVAYNGPKTGWTKFSGNYKVSSSVYALKMSFGNDGTVGNVWIDDVVIKKKTSGELIVDGSITADHITTLGITADKIKAGRLSATNNVSWLDMNNGQFNFGNGKITFNGSTLALNVDSLSIATKPVATKEQVDASILDDKKIKDTRNDNQNPQWYLSNYPRQSLKEFKIRTVMGVPGSQYYTTVTTDVPYPTNDNGNISVVQTADSKDGVFKRSSINITTWTAWTQMDLEDRINNAVTTIDKTGITVKDGSFYLEDNTSNVKYSLQAKTNPIKDHGFEMYEPRLKHATYDIWEVEAYANLDGTSRPRTDSDIYMKGNPYVYVSFIKDETSSSTSNPIFGSVSGVANSANYYSNLLTGWIKKGTTYTVSAFFKKVPLMTGGIPRIIVTHVRGINNATVATLAHSAFSQVTSEVDAIRYSLKFTVPTTYNIDNGDKIRFEYLSSNANWVMVDGLQVSEASFPSQYNEDKAAFEVARGEYTFPVLKANYVNAIGGSFTGDVYTLGQFSAGRYVSKELTAGTNLNNIVAEGWYHCPSSATVNSIANTPSNLAFSLFVEKHAGVKQTFTEYRDTYVHTFVRNMYNGYWGGWDIVVGEPIRYNISKENGWQNYGGSYSTPRYWRGSDGTVHLCGMTDGGTRTSGVRFGTLPVGYRPENREIFNVHAYDKTYTRVDVTPEGYILIMDSPKGYISFSGVSFVGRR